MKKTCLILVLLLGLMAVNGVGYVLLYPGAIFYGANQTITFSDTVNCSYIKVGDDYFVLSDMNFTLEYLSSYSCEYNLSFFNDTFDNHTTSYRFFELNCTYVYNGDAEITIDMPNDHFLIDLYIDGTLVFNNVEENTNGYYVFDHTWVSTTEYRLCFYIDGYLPGCPTDAGSIYDTNTTRVNLSWTGSSYADSYVVVRNNASYPSTPTDGYEVQNSSALFYNTTLTTTAYFSVWAYNNSGYYSPDSCKLDLPWGAIVIYQVYNESNPSQSISPFGLLISDELGTETYWNSTNTAPVYISKDDIPFGDNTVIIINASNYKTTQYYFDYAVNNFYNHTLYMPPEFTVVDPGSGDEGDDEDVHLTTRSYRFRVIDEYTYPIASVQANIKFFNNETETWESKSIVITDGYGEAEVDLVPSKNYKIFLTKTGYTQVGGVDWKPSAYSIYDPPETKIFQMERTEPEIETKAFWDIIVFTGTMYTNNTLYIYYEDTETSTTNANFHTNEVFNFTLSLIATNSTTSNTFSFWVTDINISRVHQITIHLNHTTLGWVNVTITVNSIHTPEYRKKDIEDKTVAVFGIFILGYVNFFLIFIPAIIILLAFKPRHAGLGMVGAGLYMGFSSIFITVPTPILVLVPFIVAIGIIYIIVKEGGVKL